MLVPLASLLAAAMGHWHAVFMIAAAMNAVAAILAIAVLRGAAGGGLGIAARLWQKERKKQPNETVLGRKS